MTGATEVGCNPPLRVVTVSPETLPHKKKAQCVSLTHVAWHVGHVRRKTELPARRGKFFLWGKKTDYLRAKSCRTDFLDSDAMMSSLVDVIYIEFNRAFCPVRGCYEILPFRDIGGDVKS